MSDESPKQPFEWVEEELDDFFSIFAEEAHAAQIYERPGSYLLVNAYADGSIQWVVFLSEGGEMTHCFYGSAPTVESAKKEAESEYLKWKQSQTP